MFFTFLKNLLFVSVLLLISSCEFNSNNISRFEIIPNKTIINIAENGLLQLKSIYKDKRGRIIEQSEDVNISMKYTTDNEEFVQITSGGLIEGLKSGQANIKVTLTDNKRGEKFTDEVTIIVNEVNIKKLYMNPSVVTFEQNNQSKDLTVIGIDKNDFPIKLLPEDIIFDIDKPSIVSLTKHFNNDISKIEIKINAQREDYTFITPIYNYSGVHISGSPTLLQVQQTPQPNKPHRNSIGGKSIKTINTYGSSNQKIINIVHTDGRNKIYYQKLDSGHWKEYVLQPEDTFSIDNVHIFNNNENLYIIASTDKNLYLAASDNGGDSFDEINIVEDIEIKDLQSFTIDNTFYMLYTQLSNNDLTLTTFTLESIKNPKSQVISKDTKIVEFDATLNNKNELRMTYYDGESVYYVAKQNDKFYKEKVATSKYAKGIKVIYDKLNNVNIVLFNKSFEGYIAVYSKGGLLGGWKAKKITKENFAREGIRDTYSAFYLDNITSLQAHYDNFNALRIILSEGKNVYYIKEYKGSGDSIFWRIDKIASNVGANHLTTLIDRTNRLSVFYSYEKSDWLRFWAEPVLFDYKDIIPKQSKEKDTIPMIDKNLL
jgi:hypothetical protein